MINKTKSKKWIVIASKLGKYKADIELTPGQHLFTRDLVIVYPTKKSAQVEHVKAFEDKELAIANTGIKEVSKDVKS